MAWLTTLLVVVQVIAAISIIVLVLIQHGKGADMGAAFGGGASGSLFGATGSANFLSRSTGAVATVFFLATLGLAYTGSAVKRPVTESGGVMGTVPQQPAVPAAPKDIPTSSTPAPQGAVPAAPAPATPSATPSAPPGEAPKTTEIPK